MTKQEKVLLSKAIQRELIKVEKKGYRIFYNALKESAERVMPYYEQRGVMDTLFSLNVLLDTEPIAKAYEEFYSQAMTSLLVSNLRIMIRQVGGKLNKDAIQDINIGFRSEEIIAQTAEEAKKMGLGANIVKINDYTRALIKKEIEDGLALNLTKDQIARNIKKVTEGSISKMRALRIARTETTHANSKSTKVLSNGIPFKQNKIWIPRLDGRERPEHGAMMGKPAIPKNELFLVGGEYLEYPGDPNHGASASNNVNCRCSVHYIPIAPTEEEQAITERPSVLNYLKNLLKGLLLKIILN
jgi:hypothetical protein